MNTHPAQLLCFLIFIANPFSFAYGENPDQQTEEEIQTHAYNITHEFADAVNTDELNLRTQQNILQNYNHIDRQRWIPTSLLQKALVYFDQNKTKFRNKNYVTIVDLGARSNNYRFFLINMTNGAVERYRTTHGEGSDVNNDGFAESFGNIPNSKKSSLGFVRTGEIYSGSFGRSLRLDGLSTTNSNIRRRAVVFHGWEYTREANQIQPRSWGCITMDTTLKDAVISKIANGSFMLVDTP